MIFLVFRNRIIPSGSVFHRQLHTVTDVKPYPVRIFSIHLHFYGSVTESFPVRAVLHKQIDCAELPLCHAIAASIAIIPDPMGVCGRKTHADTTFSPHTAVSHDIPFNNSFQAAHTVGQTIFALSHIHIDRTVILGNELTICADSRPSSIDGLNRTTADINIRSHRADRFIGTMPVFRFRIRQNIHKTVNRDTGSNTVSTVHSLHNGHIARVTAACAERQRSCTIMTVMNSNHTTAIGIQRGSLSIYTHSSGIIDFNLAASDSSNTDCCIITSVNRQLVAIQIQRCRLFFTAAGYGRHNTSHPRAAGNRRPIRSNRRLRFGKAV